MNQPKIEQPQLVKLPDHVNQALIKLNDSGYEAYLVGGCVRDILLNKTPNDWDITTNAQPQEMLNVFPGSKYENNFGTVLVPVKLVNQPNSVLEITTYRSESGYQDHRRPNQIEFEKNLENDLSRRDFTINAMAMDQKGQIIDYYKGQKDLKDKIIRTVGEPSDRFKEDALRLLRAVRFSCQLDFQIEPKTERAITKLAGSIKFISNERIREELVKIIASPKPYQGIKKLYETKLLQYILPELIEGNGMEQNHHHVYTVFEHNLLSLKHCPNSDPLVRLAALFHDLGKPQAKKIINNQTTFYNHEYISAKLVKKIMTRLKFPTKDIERVTNLVRNHMFYYNVDEVTEASVRRLIKKVGEQNLSDLIDLRIADRLGSGTPKAMPYKLRHLKYMFDKVRHDPVSVKMLKIDGHDLIKELQLKPGPQIGAILDVVLARVIDDPQLNNRSDLLGIAKTLTDLDLNSLRAQAIKTIDQKRLEEDQQIRQQHRV